MCIDRVELEVMLIVGMARSEKKHLQGLGSGEDMAKD